MRWESPLLRELFATLLAGSKHRRRSADHERLWFHFAGFCLRPGFGYPVDAWRVEHVYPLYEQGVQFAPDVAVWTQFWVLWRRISGGLDDAQQHRIFDDLAFYLDPNAQRRGSKPGTASVSNKLVVTALPVSNRQCSLPVARSRA